MWEPPALGLPMFPKAVALCGAYVKIVVSEIYVHVLKVWTLKMTSGNKIATSLLVLDH